VSGCLNQIPVGGFFNKPYGYTITNRRLASISRARSSEQDQVHRWISVKHIIATLCAFLLPIGLASCIKNAQPQATALPVPASSESAEQTTPSVENETGSPSSESSSASTTEPEASPTGPVNLTQASLGTILRSWPASDDEAPAEDMLTGQTWQPKEGSSGPYEFVYELPGPASIQQVVLGVGEADVHETAHVAVSSQSAAEGFADVGTYQLSGTEDQTFTLSPAVKGRWIKLSIDGPNLQDAQFIGTFDPRAPSAPVAGTWKYYDDLQLGMPADVAGVFPSLPLRSDQLTKADKVLEIRQSGNQLTAALCSDGNASAFEGSENANTVNLSAGQTRYSPAVINAEGTLMVAMASDNEFVALRVNGGSCATAMAENKPQGSGTPVLLLFDEVSPMRYAPYAQPAMGGNTALGPPLSRYRIVPEPIGLFDPETLGGYQIVVLSAICNANAVLTKTQTQALTDWVYSGGKLIIHDSDDCTNTDYSFLPYQFTSSNPGHHGASGSKLVLVESSTLGSDATDKAHFIDVKAYVADAGQQLGDANTVVTEDKHWCGHLYGTNMLGQSGYFQMYAQLGSGLIIYDGLDNDDIDVPEYQRIVLMELAQPANATLPCSQLVSAPFMMAAGGSPMFLPGKLQTVTVPLTVFASHGYSGSANLAVKAPPGWQASLSQSKVALNGASAQTNLSVSVPADAKPGRYPVTVTATDSAGNSTSTTVSIASAGAPATPAPAARTQAVPATPKIAKTLAVQKRVAVYGIYFDFASATLKPESAPVLREIANALKANPSWKLTIEGHTDNVGGVAYNLDLSRRRANSVKNALVARYHINANRLSTIGYGFSRPKASNDTPQGRALNRRVELVRN
jgi:outer membrane protein OmpA-like peptidoglycan-associated protein